MSDADDDDVPEDVPDEDEEVEDVPVDPDDDEDDVPVLPDDPEDALDEPEEELDDPEDELDEPEEDMDEPDVPEGLHDLLDEPVPEGADAALRDVEKLPWGLLARARPASAATARARACGETSMVRTVLRLPQV